jgi:hypothetical protein
MPSCTASQQEPRIEYVKPPSYLYEPCTKPERGEIKTNRDLLIYLYRLEFEYDLCAAKVEAISGYYNE